jgi:5-methylcytosine-specific restriction endonuclease McrA
MNFDIEVDERQIRQEREKARALRKQNWWKNRIAKGVCHYCGKAVPPKELTLDHIVPVARGGRSTKGNCVPACKECNNQKKNLLPIEWDEYLQRLEKQP